MLIYTEGADMPVRLDLLQRVVLRTDLTPVPATVEIDFRRDDTTAPITHGATVRVGPDQVEFVVVRLHEPGSGLPIQGARETGVVRALGLLKSCQAIAAPLQHAVIKEGATLGEIYRACGAQVRIDSDFTVPTFSAFVGMTPSFEVAKALQEESGVLIFADGRIKFRRLAELLQSPADKTMTEDACEVIGSDLLERQAIPFAISTSPAGTFVVGKREEGRSAIYRPRADQRLVNNLSTALVLRRKMRTLIALNINAGTRLDIAGLPHVVITAAHVMDKGGGESDPDVYSQFWLGEAVL
jgi:hypothetical protein